MKSIFLCLIAFLAMIANLVLATNPPVFSEIHGYKDSAFILEITTTTEGAKIYYTTDCTTPSPENGVLYTEPFEVSNTSTLRAVAVDAEGNESVLTAATYIFADDVLHQGNRPKDYPTEWGPYASISGTAIADYEMDPELTDGEVKAANIKSGLFSLPAISIITEPDYLFSHEMDDERGGIYIYTGGDAVSSGNGYGDGWLRAASVEFWENQEDADEGFQVNCAIKIHGNASRQAEKTPKHSFRMKMKGSYGPKKLNYELFGEGGGKKFDQIVIRAGFGNSWLHWLPSQQRQAMFTRDAWAKRMMKRMGYLSSATRFSHLYLNGMYWGMYNPTERIDADFCELHLGGKAEDYDVVRFDDSELNTVDGTLDDYLRLLSAVDGSDNYQTYQAMRGLDTEGNRLSSGDVLFNAENFIDYMLLNYYGGNTDWDHHNWVAVHRHGEMEGFRWLPWDSELVLQGVKDNVTKLNNAQCPTWIFNTLMEKCAAFRQLFADRAYRALSEKFGTLQPDSVLSVWEELTAEVNEGVYAEAARWGDYRQDVHPYVSRGELYTKETHFDPQCEYMRNTYFPQRTAIVLKQLQDAGLWTKVTDAPSLNIDGNTIEDYSAEIDAQQEILLKGSSAIYFIIDGSDPIIFSSTGRPTLSASANRYTKALQLTDDCFIKARIRSGANWSPLMERSIKVKESDGIFDIQADNLPQKSRCYDLMGRPVSNNSSGIYIQNGKIKVQMK